MAPTESAVLGKSSAKKAFEIGARAARWIRSEVLLTAWRNGLYIPPDRRILDGAILPYFAASQLHTRIVFVGVKRYNLHNQVLFGNKDYITVDPDETAVPFGGPRHIQAPLEALCEHIEPASAHVIIVNGVIGHGLNDAPGVERSLVACHRALSEKGELVIGLNDELATSVDVRKLPSYSKFVPEVFLPLGNSEVVLKTPLRERTHTFLFLKKAYA